MNEQACALDGCISSAGVQSHANNEEDNKDISDNSSIKHKEADKASNTKEIKRDTPSNKDQKSTEKSTNQ